MIGVGTPVLSFFASIASPTTNFLVAFGFGAVGTLYFMVWGRDLGRKGDEEVSA
jgi:hypothetical protein